MNPDLPVFKVGDAPDRAQRLAAFSSILDLLQREATFEGSAKDEKERRIHAVTVDACLVSLWAGAKGLWGLTPKSLRFVQVRDDLLVAALAHGACRECLNHSSPCPHYEDALDAKRAALRLVEERLEQGWSGTKELEEILPCP